MIFFFFTVRWNVASCGKNNLVWCSRVWKNWWSRCFLFFFLFPVFSTVYTPIKGIKQGDIMIYQSMKSTGPNNSINGGWTPLSCFSFRVLVLFTVTLSRLNETLELNRAIVTVISTTRAHQTALVKWKWREMVSATWLISTTEHYTLKCVFYDPVTILYQFLIVKHVM